MDDFDFVFAPPRKWKIWRGAHWASHALLRFDLQATGAEKSSGSGAQRSSSGHRPLFSKPRPLPEILRSDPPVAEVLPAQVETEAQPVRSTEAPVIKEELEEDDLDISDKEMEALLREPDAVKLEDSNEPNPKGKKRKASGSQPKGRLKKPRLPQFAFEIFKEECKMEGDADISLSTPGVRKDAPSLASFVQRWKQLSDKEMRRYVHLADEDRQRFEREYEEWRLKRAEAGKKEAPLQDLLERRRSMLESSLERVEKTGADCKAKRTRRPAPKIPPGFPKQPVKTAYALFCHENKARIAASLPKDGEAAQDKGEIEEPEADQPAKGKRSKGVAVLAELKKVWSELPPEEVRQYAVRMAEDQERFRKELEEWQADPANEGALDDSLLQEAQKITGKSRGRTPPKIRLPKPDAREANFLDPAALAPNSMWGALTELQALAAQGKKQRAVADAAMQRSQVAEPLLAREAMAPTAAQETVPAAAVDDLLGDLLSVEAEQALAPEGFDAGYAGEGFGGLGQFPDLEEVVSQPQALGPQLCLDESGNIVLNQSSLSRNLSNAENPIHEATANVQEAVSQYTSAYKKTPACKWTAQETQMFFEALSLYGTDLFLVQTFFRNKSAGQIKTKYCKELKKNPQMVEEALTTRSQKLTKDTFEKLHGKIDTTKHYKPPPTPEPGENPEPDGHLPEEEEDDLDDLGGMPPPEPEYSAEDESLTTNRLMALFD